MIKLLEYKGHIRNFVALIKELEIDENILTNREKREELILIEGYKNGIKSGKIYNEFVNSGTYFKIPVGRDMILTIDNAKGL